MASKGGSSWTPQVDPRVDSSWLPGSSRYPPSGSSQVTDFTTISGNPGWTPRGVDSQKNRPDASEVPGLAPPNTVKNRRDPFNFNGLRAMAFTAETVFLESLSPVAPDRTCLNQPTLLGTRLSSYRPYRPSIAICHSFRCLTQKCLTRLKCLDRLHDRLLRQPQFPGNYFRKRRPS